MIASIFYCNLCTDSKNPSVHICLALMAFSQQRAGFAE